MRTLFVAILLSSMGTQSICADVQRRVRGAQRVQRSLRPNAAAAAGALLDVGKSTQRQQYAAAPNDDTAPDNSGNPDQRRIRRLGPQDYRAMENVSDLTAPDCDKCKNFFKQNIFPPLRKGAKPCSRPAQTKAELDYCDLWESHLDSKSEGMAAALTADFNGSAASPCEDYLAEEACRVIDKCGMDPCEMCQDAVLTLPFQKAVARIQSRCEKANQAAEENEDTAINSLLLETFTTIKRKTPRPRHGDKRAMVDGCKSISASTPEPWKDDEARRLACWDLKFCAPGEPRWSVPACSERFAGSLASGAATHDDKKTWISHSVARTCHYRYRSKVSQKATQSQRMGQNMHTEAEQKDTWVTADVEMKYTGRVDGGLARLQMVVTDASIASEDKHGKMIESPIDETDREFYFTQTSGGEIHRVEHPPDEKFFLITLKKEIAAMHHLSGEAMNLSPGTTTSLLETDNLGVHDATYMVELSETHYVVRKSKKRVSHHKGVFGGATVEHHGSPGVTLFHEVSEKIFIHRESGTIDRSEKKHTVSASTF